MFQTSAGAAALMASGTGWAAVGHPSYLAAGQWADQHHLLALRSDGSEVFRVALPGRGHAAAVHHSHAHAIVFARRPGTFAIVIDCTNGSEAAQLRAPTGRHFYGHGAFSADGELLFTTENAYESGEGRLGIWDASAGYIRVGEISSGGVGPHDVILMPDGQTLAVANGGIRTHPATGREKLNLPEMRPRLSYLRLSDGVQIQTVEPPPELRRNSIRHLAVSTDGLVAVAMQWQGSPGDGVPLLASHRIGWDALEFAQADSVQLAAMQGYAGSVAFDATQEHIAITSPRGGRVMAWGSFSEAPRVWSRADVCGLSAAPSGWIATDGYGGAFLLSRDLSPRSAVRHQMAFDNHLIAVDAVT